MEYEALLAKQALDNPTVLANPPGGIRYPMEVGFLTKGFFDRATAAFAKARELAGTDATLVARVERAELPLLYAQLARGPSFVGKGYNEMVDRFGRIAKREGAQNLAEAPANLEPTLAAWRASAVKEN